MEQRLRERWQKAFPFSKYQNQAGPIDWDAMKADGVTFAMIRVGYLNDLDPYLKKIWRVPSATASVWVCSSIPWRGMKRLRGRRAQYVLEQIRDIRFPIRLPTM
ncbi:MAG: hypothetical protein V8S58_15465 [Lachnospiraceae bacterium]